MSTFQNTVSKTHNYCKKCSPSYTNIIILARCQWGINVELVCQGAQWICSISSVVVASLLSDKHMASRPSGLGDRMKQPQNGAKGTAHTKTSKETVLVNEISLPQ